MFFDNDDIQATHLVHVPYTQLPKILRYLSFIDDQGLQKPLNERHTHYLAYLYEVPKFYKSLRQQARELRWSKTTVVKIRDELAKPMVEIGVPIIYISEFTDIDNEPRTEIEVYKHQKEMGAYYDKLYNKETGHSYREQWIDLANSFKEFKKSLGGPADGPRVVQQMDHNDNNKKKPKKTTTKEQDLQPSADSSSFSATPEDSRLDGLPINDKTKRNIQKLGLDDEQIQEAIKATEAANPDSYGGYLYDQCANAAQYSKHQQEPEENKIKASKQALQEIFHADTLPDNITVDFGELSLTVRENGSIIAIIGYKDTDSEESSKALAQHVKEKYAD